MIFFTYLERFLGVEHSAGQFENVVGDCALLGECVLHAHRRLGDALDQDVAHVVHLQLEALQQSYIITRVGTGLVQLRWAEYF